MAPHRTAMPMSLSVTRVLICDGWHTVSRLVVNGRRWRLAMHCTRAATGHIGPPKAS